MAIYAVLLVYIYLVWCEVLAARQGRPIGRQPAYLFIGEKKKKKNKEWQKAVGFGTVRNGTVYGNMMAGGVHVRYDMVVRYTAYGTVLYRILARYTVKWYDSGTVLPYNGTVYRELVRDKEGTYNIL